MGSQTGKEEGKGSSWPEGAASGGGPGEVLPEAAHTGSRRKKSIKEGELNSEIHPSGQRRGDTTEGRRLAHFCPLLLDRRPARASAPWPSRPAWGHGLPLSAACCRPRCLYPSFRYTSSVLINNRNNSRRGNWQGEQGSGKDTRDLKAFGPSNGEGGGDTLEISAPSSSSHRQLLYGRSWPCLLLTAVYGFL